MPDLTRPKNVARARKAGALSLAVAVTAALLVSTSGAATAGPASSPDGGPAATGSENHVLTDCRGDIQHRIVTSDQSSSTTGNSFVSFVSRAVRVPAGTSRCLLVEFNAETACSGDSGASDDFCYLRALANGTEMLPLSSGFTAFESETRSAESNSHRWVRRVPAGTYNVVLQRRTDGGNTRFYLDDWMFSLSVLR